MLVAVLTVVVILALCLDLVHNVRIVYGLLLYGNNQRKLSVLDTSIQKKICLPFDLDIFLHMNNANYLKHCDIARFQLWKEIRIDASALGGSMTLGGSCNRYRKPITLFTKYTIHTRIIYWDDSAFYVEQTFIRDSDGFVCFISLSKMTVIKVKPQQIIEKNGYDVEKPEILPELRLWIESTNSSSERLRKKS